MHAYRSGLATPVHRSRATYRAGTVVGFRLVNSPGYLLDEIERLDGEVQATEADLERYLSDQGCHFNPTGLGTEPDRSGDPPQCAALYNFWSGPWMAYKAKWTEFRDAHNSGGLTGVWERFWGSLEETVSSYRSQLAGMQDAAKKVGFGLTVPAPVAPRAGAFDAAGDAVSGLAGLVKFLVFAAVGVGAFLLLTMLLRGGSVGGKLLVVKG